jgi:hypothetical protein
MQAQSESLMTVKRNSWRLAESSSKSIAAAKTLVKTLKSSFLGRDKLFRHEDAEQQTLSASREVKVLHVTPRTLFGDKIHCLQDLFLRPPCERTLDE